MKKKKTSGNRRDWSSVNSDAIFGEKSKRSLFAKAKRKEKSSDSNDEELSQVVEDKLVELKKAFGRNLARIRQNAGYSQLALSVEVDLTHNFINEIEQGSKGVSFETLVRFSIILRTPISRFFEPPEHTQSHEDYQYEDAIDHLMAELHETIDIWNDKRTK
jgi:transcriptional regulator with XRE-family HTH domain